MRVWRLAQSSSGNTNNWISVPGANTVWTGPWGINSRDIDSRDSINSRDIPLYEPDEVLAISSSIVEVQRVGSKVPSKAVASGDQRLLLVVSGWQHWRSGGRGWSCAGVWAGSASVRVLHFKSVVWNTDAAAQAARSMWFSH